MNYKILIGLMAVTVFSATYVLSHMISPISATLAAGKVTVFSKSGSGDSDFEVAISAGQFELSLTHTGISNFIVWGFSGQELLVNTIGQYSD